jgi:hypothetical protein
MASAASVRLPVYREGQGQIKTVAVRIRFLTCSENYLYLFIEENFTNG